MDEINQVYEPPQFDFKKILLLVGSAGVLGFAMFMTFLLQNNKDNLSVQPSRAEQVIPTRRPTEVEPSRGPNREQRKPVQSKEDIDEALKELDTADNVLNEIEKSVRTMTPDSFNR